jgi:ATP-dependent DNA ligase
MKSSSTAIARSPSRTTAAPRSRNDNDFSRRSPTIVKALAGLPNETVIDGEVVALDETGKPSFNVLQNYGSSPAYVFYYVFDVLVLASRDVMGEPLASRRAAGEDYKIFVFPRGNSSRPQVGGII